MKYRSTHVIEEAKFLFINNKIRKSINYEKL